jgi:hypothetical protein
VLRLHDSCFGALKTNFLSLLNCFFQ